MIGYFISHTPDHGWILESVKVAKNVSGESFLNLHGVLENFVKSCETNVYQLIKPPVSVH